jgi:hypothetical protein
MANYERSEAVSKETYTVMHDRGEDVDGKNVRPYETFKADPTPELDEKVAKGYLQTKASITPSKKKAAKKRAKG